MERQNVFITANLLDSTILVTCSKQSPVEAKLRDRKGQIDLLANTPHHWPHNCDLRALSLL